MDMDLISLTVLFVLSSSVIGLVYLYLVWNFNYWKCRNVNGPKPRILFGNLPSLVRKHRNYNFEIAEIYEKFKKTGDRFVGIFMTRNPVVLILDPLLARDVLTNKFKSFSNNELSLWGNRATEKVSIHHPFITRTDEDWKERRNDFISGISDSKLQQTYPILVDVNHKMTNFLRSEMSKTGGIIEIESLSYKYVVDFVANFVYGIDANVFTSGIPTNPMYNHSRNLMDYSFKQIEQFYLLGIVPYLKKIVKNRFFDEETDNYFIGLQKVAIDMRLKNKNDRFDFLNYILKLQEKKNLSNMDVVVHSMSVVLDAVDTTAFVILHTLFLLAYNPKTQEKLRHEIRENMNEEGEIGFKTLLNLEYLDQCISESIRIFSPNPILSKICTEEISLEVNNDQTTKIEPGMIVHIPCFSYHHDPEIYPDPEEFIPERFDNGQAKKFSQQGQFIPFSDGPRICAGLRLAQMQCKACVFELVKNFELRVSKKTQYGQVLSRSHPRYYLTGDIDIEFVELAK